MKSLRFNPALPLLAFGLLVFGLAGLSIADMFIARPFDGIVLQRDSLLIGEVIKGSGAQRAGIRPADRLIGIGREALTVPADAGRTRIKFRIGETVPYLIETPTEGVREVAVELGRFRLGDGTYIYASALGFAFFFFGLFVLLRRPALRASQVFFLLCGLFLLFLVCRLRPPSYAGIDTWVLGIGTVAFLLLPAAFLHFYLIFPRPALLRSWEKGRWRALVQLWRAAWPAIYLVPPAVFLLTRGGRQISGLPVASWWLLALYLIVGLAALGGNSRRLKSQRERQGVAMVLAGSVFGLFPFLVATLWFGDMVRGAVYFVVAIMPLALVPLTFTYAIVRFQLLDIQVILRRSLLYTLTTALVTGLYAGAIAGFSTFFRGTRVAASPYSPLILALVIVLLFEPLRRLIQGPVDRFFFAGRSRLQRAMVELGEALSDQLEPQRVVEELVERLPQLLDLEFAALYLLRDYRLVRQAGPTDLPADLPVVADLQGLLRRRASITRLSQIGTLALRSQPVHQILAQLEDSGVVAVADLATRRRHIGMVLLSGKRDRLALEREELDLVQSLMHQASLALETSLLLAERTQQAELEREMEIAATVQKQVLPQHLELGAGWHVAAVCRPARVVGGDFYAQIPGERSARPAIVFGDVSGKSVSGALMMMAAHEALHALAMTQPRPDELFTLANRRLYSLGRRSFVALGYFAVCCDGHGESDDSWLRYLVAGQPAPILCRANSLVEELPLPEERTPLGAFNGTQYSSLEAQIAPGEVVLGYSDGVTDARSPSGEFFGVERLLEVLSGAPADADELVADVLAAIDDFTRGGPRYDDVTLVAIGRMLEVSK